jgi:hypothetical protein
MQYGNFDGAHREYIIPLPDSPHAWVNGINPYPNPVEGSDHVWFLSISDDQPDKENTL